MERGDNIKLNFTEDDLKSITYSICTTFKSPYKWYKKDDKYVYIGRLEDSTDAIVQRRSRFLGGKTRLYLVPIEKIELIK